MNLAVKDSKAKILQSFERILEERRKIDSKIATKEQEAEKEKNQEILDKAANYTVDVIVKGLADLQLDFGSIVNELTEKISTETLKLEELKRAKEIETQRLQQLQKVRVVADALYILTQEHQEKLNALRQNAATQQENLEKERVEMRKVWLKEQEEFILSQQEYAERTQRDRQRLEEEYNYEIERLRKVEADDYTERKRILERTLQLTTQEKEKQWQEREKFLSDNAALFAENRQKVEGFEEASKKAYIQAKEEAIQDVNREAKVQAELREKEWQGTKQGYELKIQSLEQTIQRQTEQIGDLSTQLQAAMKQSQELAMRAFSSNSVK
ncbi:hypothetical protein H6G20_18780 [Desertifilum sp. FACHB-1129]|uniref:Uncharacterized protein n=2 Tax=Desertifilum tharense IPPAS B-1220 TaxID=1781255 RepID=A0A1E5QMC0_9CYAN|nr:MULTISPECIES: hypothetical protein [Desertifilum]MDA0213346.1 hypothetical protein [Cyanobacteria bacterium FC1]MBD2313717.1 hypothetical protein [Desertifilum sp. FACHB-1129]MBD2325011.1 hypothetical protein [Desertifilum sp. FACHB-866]MBD2335150.1 hypothetical protein [Desertifilum sp. FACHB-868]OEJ75744.1 hypothetical protein BH720_08180 [Desertifilum tharense IPPAS B-1220]